MAQTITKLFLSFSAFYEYQLIIGLDFPFDSPKNYPFFFLATLPRPVIYQYIILYTSQSVFHLNCRTAPPPPPCRKSVLDLRLCSRCNQGLFPDGTDKTQHAFSSEFTPSLPILYRYITMLGLLIPGVLYASNPQQRHCKCE